MKYAFACLLVVLLALPCAALAQAPQQAGTLTIAGQTDQAPIVRIRGKAYVDIESLARITHGSIRYQGSQTILALPGGGSDSTSAVQPNKAPQLSGGFLGAEIEALTAIREWRASLVNAVQNNYPVTDDWVSRLRRSADTSVQLAAAATSTDSDQKGLELLRNEFSNMQQMSSQFVAMHTQVNYIDPNSFTSNPMDQKILTCARALGTMAASKEFQDEPSCH
jgi:hypothetical protein